MDLSKHAPLRIEDIRSKYKVIDKVGRGTYGTVFKVLSLQDNKYYAIKKFENTQAKLQVQGFPITALREISLLKQLHHPNIINLKQIICSRPNRRNLYRGSTFLVFDYMHHDFSGLFRNKIKFSLSQTKCIMKQLLEGCNYLHQNKVMHRDIKSANLLMGDNGNVQLADFGLGRRTRFDNVYTYKVVTLWYRAPQLLLGNKSYNHKVDLWSLGCVFAEFLIGDVLFKKETQYAIIEKIYQICGDLDENQYTQDYLRGCVYYHEMKSKKSYKNNIQNYIRSLNPNVDELSLRFLKGLLELNPYQRFSCEEALSHDFFKELPLPCLPEQIHKLDVQYHQMFRDRSLKIDREKQKQKQKRKLSRDWSEQQAQRKLKQKYEQKHIQTYKSSQTNTSFPLPTNLVSKPLYMQQKVYQKTYTRKSQQKRYEPYTKEYSKHYEKDQQRKTYLRKRQISRSYSSSSSSSSSGRRSRQKHRRNRQRDQRRDSIERPRQYKHSAAHYRQQRDPSRQRSRQRQRQRQRQKSRIRNDREKEKQRQKDYIHGSSLDKSRSRYETQRLTYQNDKKYSRPQYHRESEKRNYQIKDQRYERHEHQRRQRSQIEYRARDGHRDQIIRVPRQQRPRDKFSDQRKTFYLQPQKTDSSRIYQEKSKYRDSSKRDYKEPIKDSSKGHYSKEYSRDYSREYSKEHIKDYSKEHIKDYSKEHIKEYSKESTGRKLSLEKKLSPQRKAMGFQEY